MGLLEIRCMYCTNYLRATLSSTRPSRIKCFFRTSGCGFPLSSNTSSIVSNSTAGCGTSKLKIVNDN